MSERGHFLKPNHGNEQWQRCVYVDTETTPSPIAPGVIGHKLAFGWACYRQRIRGESWRAEDWWRFDSLAQWWDGLEARLSPRTRTWVWCHNSAFDYPVLDAFREPVRRGWVVKRLICDGPPTLITLRRGPCTLVLADTLNIWRMPLRVLGNSLGVPKLPMPGPDAPRGEWDTYCRQDVTVIMRAVESWSAFLTHHQLGGAAGTLASQAFRAWRHRFMRHRVLIDNHPRALTLAREAYMGGRTEAWFIGQSRRRYHLLDVHSMYPTVMQRGEFPSVLVGYSRHAGVPELRAALHKFCVCAQVTIRAREPMFPYRCMGKLIFPVGTFTTTLATPELRAAMAAGAVRKVHAMATYEHAPLFRDFVSELYALRCECAASGDKVTAWQVKILMNSLYGKYGQSGRVYETTEHTDDLTPRTWLEADLGTGGVVSMRQVLGEVQVLKREPESAQSHPAIAAHVTAEARLYLWSLIEVAGRTHVYYMDTDSLLVDDVGYAALADRLHPSRLGTLSVEWEGTDIELWGAKDYRLGKRVKRKGIRAQALEVGPGVFEQDKWSGLRGLIASGNLTTPTTSRVTKHMHRRYDKGRVLSSGRVVPWTLSLSSPVPAGMTKAR